MKKTLLLLLAAALVLSLAACGAGQSGKETEAPGETSAPGGETAGSETVNNETTGSETSGGETSGTPEQAVPVNFAVLTGPTGMGAVKLMESSDKGETRNRYTVSALADNQQIQAGLINGDFDIAAVATNVAAALYNKTQGQVQVVALNTLGVLYILEKGDTVHSVADLKGKTVYSPGQGANPEYALKYILTRNGLTVSTDQEPVEDADVQIVFDDAGVIQTKMAAGEIDLAMLPSPPPPPF